MKTVLLPLLETLIDLLRSRVLLQLELLALRQQLAMTADHDSKRLRFRRSERLFWVWLYRLWLTCLLPRACYRAPATARLLPRACMYGEPFRNRVKILSIEEVLTAPRSPWQSPDVERLIGSIRRECLNHIIIFNERHLRRQLNSYATCYHEARTHLSLDQQCPVPRLIRDPDQESIVAVPHLGGLHHEYRRAA